MASPFFDLRRQLLAGSLLLAASASAAELTVKLEPRWGQQALTLNEVMWTNAAHNTLSLTRLAMLLSHAQLQQADGRWIGAQDWVAFVDVAQKRLRFSLTGLPAERFIALRFDLGLDDSMDKADAAQWPSHHALNPDVNGLHWSWRGQYVFLALEGRYQQTDGQLGGFSYHLAGQPCRGTIELPMELDLRQNLLLTLALHVDRLFSAQHRLDLTEADTTHSRDDGGLAERLADNAVRAFSVMRLEADLTAKQAETAHQDWKPKLLADRVPAHFPAVALPSDNPLTEAGIDLGRRLFHDPRLSINSTQSCAQCHRADNAYADPRRVSLGAEGQVGRRQAMALFNLAWKPAFFWDGRVRTLREQVLKPIEDPDEMHESLDHVVTKLSDLAPSFQSAFGTSQITADLIARALEQFLLTLISADSALDQTLTQGRKLSASEQRGFELFFTESDPARGLRGADCFHCHGGAHLTNHQMLNNGLDDEASLRDEGLAKITGLASDRGKFIVPSLRNIARTAPYMHDGRFATLEEVIEHYDHGLQRSPTLDPNLAKHLRHQGLQLSAADKAALVAFLHTLTEEAFGK